MVNEAGHFPEVCKKSLQAMVSDMQGGIAEVFRHVFRRANPCFSPRELEHCGRLTQPMLHRRGENYYQPISWDEAIRRIADKLRSRLDETFWYTSGRSSNEAGFLVQLFARLYGTNNVNNCSYYVTRPAASAWPTRSAPAPRPCSWRISSIRTWCSSSAVIRPAIIRA